MHKTKPPNEQWKKIATLFWRNHQSYVARVSSFASCGWFVLLVLRVIFDAFNVCISCVYANIYANISRSIELIVGTMPINLNFAESRLGDNRFPSSNAIHSTYVME